jgi:hypothetical protein
MLWFDFVGGIFWTHLSCEGNVQGLSWQLGKNETTRGSIVCGMDFSWIEIV